MALYQPSQAVFYQPCESNRVETLLGKTWNATNVSGYVPFMHNSGVASASGAGAGWMEYPNTDYAYPYISGVSPTLFAVHWVSGVEHWNGIDYGIGYSNSTSAIQHGAKWRINGAAAPWSGVRVQIMSYSGVQRSITGSSVYPERPEPMMVATWVEWIAEDVAVGKISINGGPWLLSASGTLNKTNVNIKAPMLLTPRRVETGVNLYDEAALWMDLASEPAQSDLTKMYAMGLAGAPLDTFDTFVQATSVSGSSPLSVHGLTDASGTVPLSVTGSITSSGWSPLTIPQAHAVASGQTNAVMLGAVSASGSIPMAMMGVAAPGASFDFSIEYLLRTLDHYPQVIGKLGYTEAGDVNIEVWRCGPSGVEAAALASSGCYPIGNTGRWGWSTEHLDTGGASDRRAYFYRMTAPNGNTFKGSFFVNDTTGMPGSRKRSRRREKR